MLRVRKILLRGAGQEDALVEFAPGSNVLAGDSDTGKSYLVYCLDYIFGADEMRKRIPEAELYSQLYIEFENSKGCVLTLERSLAGGQLAAHDLAIDAIRQPGKTILSKRTRGSGDDVTAVLFPFAGIGEAQLRKNDRGETQRLTIRTMLPVFVVDEVSIIDDRSSPVLGTGGFDRTARKRMMSYLLSGKDDTGIVAAERDDIVRARISARLGVIDDLLNPLEQRWKDQSFDETEQSIERLDATIASLSQSLDDTSVERETLEEERRDAVAVRQKADSQILAIDELLGRYKLLDERYGSDLERLDFVAEGSHFFDALQEVRCPLCDQLMTSDHAHTAQERSAGIYDAARAEAAKILALRTDLSAAIASLNARREQWSLQSSRGGGTLERVDKRIATILAPAAQSITDRLDRLVTRRVEMEAARKDQDQIQTLRALKGELQRATQADDGVSKWEPLPSSALRKFCQEIEAVLKDWKWGPEPRVEFDQTEYDIIVDGQDRRSHGKGVRAVLYAAFAIGLLRYCASNDLPHLGLVVIDSPLTSYKKGKSSANGGDKPVDAGIEAAFWTSLKTVPPDTQIIVIENKEPPEDIAAAVHYEWFAGENALPGQRRGFIPG
ncbi:MAG: hypothetical protein DI528_06780 [Shinella sp.]|nr:MAG: hypothetical protein DI528_06780 [Shinella sp.]